MAAGSRWLASWSISRRLLSRIFPDLMGQVYRHDHPVPDPGNDLSPALVRMPISSATTRISVCDAAPQRARGAGQVQFSDIPRCRHLAPWGARCAPRLPAREGPSEPGVRHPLPRARWLGARKRRRGVRSQRRSVLNVMLEQLPGLPRRDLYLCVLKAGGWGNSGEFVRRVRLPSRYFERRAKRPCIANYPRLCADNPRCVGSE